MRSTSNQRGVTLVTRLFPPDMDTIGRHVEQLAEWLARRGLAVTVICGGCPERVREWREDIRVIRVRLPPVARSSRMCRSIDWILFAFASALTCLIRRPRDLVVCTSFPPTLAPAMALLRRRTCLWCLDVYPEALALAGMLVRGGRAWKIISAANDWAVGRMRAIVTLNAKMAQTIAGSTERDDVHLIELWADPRHAPAGSEGTNEARKALGFTSEFVALYAGNLGIGHDADTLLDSILRTTENDRLRWVLVGSGEGRVRIDHHARQASAPNLVSLPYQPDERMPALLSMADVHIVTLRQGFDAVMFPSKLLAAIASGKPVVAVCEPESELGRIVLGEGIGLVIEPGDGAALVSAMEHLRRSPEWLEGMRRRLFELARGRFSAEVASARWGELLRNIV